MSDSTENQKHENDEDEDETTAPRWTNRRQYILSCIGYTVGLGNFWRFPWLVKEYGGGAFLIAYVILFLLVGVPLLYMELAIGRLMRTYMILTWKKISKYAIGIGVTSVLASFMTCTYYIVVIAWCLLYFISSFQYPLPWTQCPENAIGNKSQNELECTITDSVEYHWYRRTLNISPSINEGWTLHTDIFISFLLMWTVLLLSLYKGIESAGKVVYFTAIFPYIALAVLLLRGIFLDGAVDIGLAHFIHTEWSLLAGIDVWYNAATQVIYSMGISLGVWMTYSSFCPVEQNILTDTLYSACADIGSSLLGGLVIFQILGFRATRKFAECIALNDETYQNQSIKFILSTANESTLCNKTYYMEEASSGSGLAFIAFSESIIHLPGSPFFSVLFFLLLVALGTDSMFGMMDVLVDVINMKKTFKHKTIPVLIVCIPTIAIGITMVTRAGSYVMEIIMVYATDLPVVVVGLCESLAIAYLYGGKRFANDVEKTCKQKVPLFFVICWYIISPLCIIAVVALRVYKYLITKPEFQTWDTIKGGTSSIPYPDWAYSVAIILCVVTLLPLPIGFFYGLIHHIYRRKKRNSYELRTISTRSNVAL